MNRLPLAVLALSLMAPAASYAQTFSAVASSSSLLPPDPFLNADAPSVTTAAATGAPRSGPFSSFGMGVQVGLLGLGVQAATPLAWHLNLRGGGNFFEYSDALSSDGVNYSGTLRFRSGQASLDWFPWAGRFHISPGVLFANGNQVTASGVVPGGSSFTLNNTSYVSSTSNPVEGSASLTFAKVAPMLTVGWGNLVPRDGRHVSIPFEFGAAYQGYPQVGLNFSGSVCDSTGLICQSIASDPSVQANVTAEQQKFAHDLAPARFYPILSSGFAYRF